MPFRAVAPPRAATTGTCKVVAPPVGPFRCWVGRLLDWWQRVQREAAGWPSGARSLRLPRSWGQPLLLAGGTDGARAA